MKYCTKCGKTKPVEDFNLQPDAKLGRNHQCRPCQAKYSRAYAIAHPEGFRARQSKYRAKNQEKVAAAVTAYHATHREEGRACARAWAKAHPERFKANSAARRARKLGARVGCRKAYRAFVQNSRTAKRISCYWCHKRTARGSRHLDHIFPLSKGGADAIENLCVSCINCNQRKWSKTPFEFAGQGELHFVA